MHYIISISRAQFLSHRFLADLASEQVIIESITDSQLVVEGELSESAESRLQARPDSVDSHHQEDSVGKLVLCGESLNLEKICLFLKILPGDVCGIISLVKNNALGVIAKISLDEVPDDLVRHIEELAQALQIEIAYLPKLPKLTEPGVLLMDMDSTVIGIECIDEIAKLAGVGDKVSEVTELAMQGKLDFAQSLHQRVACLEGIDVSLLEQIRDRLPLTPGLTSLLSELKQHGWIVAIASGGFTFFADYLKERLDLDFAISNTLAQSEGELLGKVVGEVIDANVKAQTLIQLREQYGIDKEQTIAIGDGANDLIMMGEAGLGIAYHAKPIVRKQAMANIRFGGLDVALAFFD